MKIFRTVVSSPLSQLGSCLFVLALSVGCGGDDVKKVVSLGEGGEGGEAGAPFGSNNDASTDAGTGGADRGSAGEGKAGEGVAQTEGGAAQTEGGAGGAPGVAAAGASPDGEAGAAGAVSADGAAGAGGEGETPTFPVSSCGQGMWLASEVGCQACPTTTHVFEMACEDYKSGQILMGLSGQLQFAFVNLPDGVQGHEASPVDVSVAYVTPDESHSRIVRLSTSAWNVDLSAASAQPAAVIIPPFSTADVCGDVFRSLDPVRFNRIGDGTTAAYERVCP